MIELKVKGKEGLRFTGPADWTDVPLSMFLSFIDAKDGAQELAALTGQDEAIFRSAPAEISLVVEKAFAFLGRFPDLVNMKVPKYLEDYQDAKDNPGYLRYYVPKSIGSQCTYQQKLIVEEYIREQRQAGIEPTFVNSARFLLAVYMFNEITSHNLTDVEQIEKAYKVVDRLPAIPALRVASFFLDNTIKMNGSGLISYRLVHKQKKSLLVKLLPQWFLDFWSFKTITRYKA